MNAVIKKVKALELKSNAEIIKGIGENISKKYQEMEEANTLFCSEYEGESKNSYDKAFLTIKELSNTVNKVMYSLRDGIVDMADAFENLDEESKATVDKIKG